MWPRKRIDISWHDLGVAAGYGLNFTAPPPPTAATVKGWLLPEESLVCLSVRSGFDLLLQALKLPQGSQVIVSAVTIPDMLQIIEHHGLVPVPVEVDSELLEPSIASVQQAITTKSRLILVAHLFGSFVAMESILRLANQHRLLVVEDCAQAFVGLEFAGHSASDVSLFSFGPIKTATALGGAVVRVKQPELLQKMHSIQQAYTYQNQSEFLARTAKYALLKFASFPWLYGLIERLCYVCGINHDKLMSRLGHNFASESLLPNIRRQPCVALQKLLTRRLQQYSTGEPRQLRSRAQVGRYLTRGIQGTKFRWVGHANVSHSYWVLAVYTERAKKLIDVLRQSGFDATMRSSLCDAQSTVQRSTFSVHSRWLEQTVFVPCDPKMPLRELNKLRRMLQEVLMAR